MLILFIVVMHLAIQALSLASVQVCHSNKGLVLFKYINITELKIPTCRRQTSWLFTKRHREFRLRTTEKQIPTVVGWGP